MEHLPRSRLLAHHGGRHFASEAHVRMQVLPVPAGRVTGDLFDNHHGELLVNCLDGACLVVTASKSIRLEEGDQVLLIDGEPFKIDGAPDVASVVQLIWMPGLNPCRTCWENSRMFFE